MKTIKVKSEDTLYNAASLFKNFADSTRIRILFDLLTYEKQVNEIVNDLNMTQSAISHQLSILKASKLIKSRKDGKLVYYSLADNHVYNILLQGIEHTEEWTNKKS